MNGEDHILLTDHRLNSPPEAMFYKHFLMTTFSLFRYPMVNITLKAQKSWKWTGNILVFSRTLSAINYRLGEKFTSSCERVRDCQLIAKTDAVHSVVGRPFQSHSLFTLSLRYLLHLPQPHYRLPPSPSPSPHPPSSRTPVCTSSKGQYHETFCSPVFHQSTSPGPNRHAQKRYQFFLNIRGCPVMNTLRSRLEFLG